MTEPIKMRAPALPQEIQDRLLAHTDRAATEPRPMPDIPAELNRIQSEISSARWRDTVPRRYWDARLEDLNPTGRNTGILARWAYHQRGGGVVGRPNLVILGPVGTGKSHAAAAVVRPLAEDGLEVVFAPSVELLDDLRPGGGGPARYMAADVLVVDDLGGERPTDWTAEQLYMIVNRRYNDCLPTVATANDTPADLKEAIGARLYSRLVGDGAVVLGLSGVDRRITKS